MWAREGPGEATRHLPRVSTWRAPALGDAFRTSSGLRTSRALPDRGQSVHWYKRPSQSRHTHNNNTTTHPPRRPPSVSPGGGWRPPLVDSQADPLPSRRHIWRPGYRVGWPLVPSWGGPPLHREDRATAHHTHTGSITSKEAGGNDPMAGNPGDIRTADNMSDTHCIHRSAVERRRCISRRAQQRQHIPTDRLHPPCASAAASAVDLRPLSHSIPYTRKTWRAPTSSDRSDASRDLLRHSRHLRLAARAPARVKSQHAASQLPPCP